MRDNEVAKLRALMGYSAITIGVVATIASGQTNEAVLVNESGATTESVVASGDSDGSRTTDEVATFGVGDRVALGDWQVQVHSMTDPYDNDSDLFNPAEGNRWVAIDAEVFNAGDEPRDVTSLFCFDLQDSANRNFGQQLFSGSTIGAPSGEVAPGSSRRGTIVYEVPADSAGFRLNFKCELFSSGSATIEL